MVSNVFSAIKVIEQLPKYLTSETKKGDVSPHPPRCINRFISYSF